MVRVEGCNESGCGVGAIREVTTRPTRPANLSVVGSEERPLELTATWGTAQGMTFYLAKWRRSDRNFSEDNQLLRWWRLPGGKFSDEERATTGMFTLSGHGDWVVRVEGCNEGGCGPGITQRVTPKPSAPTNLVVSPAATKFEMAATWDAAAGATSYVLNWGRAGESLPAENQVATAETAADFTVSNYGTWTVQVKGCNAAGCGPEVSATAVAWLSVCDRTPEVRDKLVEILDKKCGAITDQDLARVWRIDLGGHYPWSDRNTGIDNLKVGDFQGLHNVTFLELHRNILTTVSEDIFNPLVRLRVIYLQENFLTEVPEDLFAGMNNLEQIHLQENRLTKVPEGLFDGLSKSSVYAIRLDRNKLTELPPGVFDDLPSLQSLDLRHNKLTELPSGIFDGLSSLNYLDLRNNPGAPFPLDLPGVRIYQ